jgi:hypothetical protein
LTKLLFLIDLRQHLDKNEEESDTGDLATKFEEFGASSNHYREIYAISNRIYHLSLDKLAFQAGLQLNLETVYLRNMKSRDILIAYSSSLKESIIASLKYDAVYWYIFSVHEVFFAEVTGKKKYLAYDHNKGHADYTDTPNNVATDDRDRHAESLDAKTLFVDDGPSELIDLIADKIEEFLSAK